MTDYKVHNGILELVAMQGGWTYIPPEEDRGNGHGQIKVSDTVVLWFSSAHDANKMSCNVVLGYSAKTGSLIAFHQSYSEDELPIPSIEFSALKSPDAIVADIKRRMIPQAIAKIAQLQERLDAHNAYHNRAQAVSDRLKAIVPGLELRNQGEEHNLTFNGSEKGYGDIQVSDTTINLLLHSIPVDVAEKILKVLEDN